MKYSTLKKSSLTSLSALGLASAAHSSILSGVSFDQTVSAAFNEGNNSDTFQWDIDGDGNNDASFKLSASHTFAYDPFMFMTFIQSNAGISMLDDGNLSFAQIRDANSLASVASTAVGALTSATFSQKLDASSFFGSVVKRPNFSNGSTVGFQFQREAQQHYGVAELSVFFGETEVTSVRLSLTNVRWNSVPGGDIRGNSVAVPEPASFATGLGLLALGAAGVRCWRRQPRAN